MQEMAGAAGSPKSWTNYRQFRRRFGVGAVKYFGIFSKGRRLTFAGWPGRLPGWRLKKLNGLLFNKSSSFSQQVARPAFFCLLLFNLP
jgi:hypothetical protein